MSGAPSLGRAGPSYYSQWLLLLIVILFCVFPFYWMVTTSVKASDNVGQDTHDFGLADLRRAEDLNVKRSDADRVGRTGRRRNGRCWRLGLCRTERTRQNATKRSRRLLARYALAAQLGKD